MSTALEILEETDDFVVVNKPSGLLSIPDREGDQISLKQLLKEKYGVIYTVHRIDQFTSGLIVFARNEETHKFLSQAFEERAVDKEYIGIVKGCPLEKHGIIDQPIAQHSIKHSRMIIHKRGKNAVTEYEVADDFVRFAVVNFRIFTGRTHQIRLHAQFIGHPIVCDELYGDGLPILLSSIKKNYNLSKSELEERPILSRLGLHAARLAFTTPDGIRHELSAPLPKDMRAFVQQLAKTKKHGR